MKALAQLDGRVEDWQACDRSVEVQLIPRRAALEALVKLAFQVSRERAAPG